MNKIFIVFSVIVCLSSCKTGRFLPEEKKEENQITFSGKLVSVHSTGKRHQSYVFRFCIIKLIEGKYNEKEIFFECYEEFNGRELIKTFDCSGTGITKCGVEEIYDCEKTSARISLVEKTKNRERYFLFREATLEE